eukprot:TRINITY_DN2694_c0_g3_i1.p1 TRINITY_DN2694_c0_g3~~TRINITY_DN2694_c0_g3_i1.p1  ORF type:complete len:314 (-),score=55.91 TRINITY_DN2694_c0_g3_i1:28-969(-)
MDQTISELQAKLAEHKSQLRQVEELLITRSDDETLMKLREDLQQVIQLTEDLTHAKSAKVSSKGDSEEKNVWHVGERCQAKDGDGKWHTARIDSIEEHLGSFMVTFLDYGNTAEVVESCLRKYRPVSADQLRPGMQVRALFTGDGLFYDAVIDQITERGTVLVTFQQYGDTDEVPVYDIQVHKSAKKRAVEEELPDQPIIPESLKPKPTDTEAERESKRRRIKAIKNKHRLLKLEQEQSKRQNAWQDFKVGAVKSKKKALVGVRKGPSMFASPDSIEGKVGVVGSGHGMTDFQQRINNVTLKPPAHVPLPGDT